MTLITWKVDLALMEVLMTVSTCGVNGLKVPLFMTAFAGCREVSASELKATACVIKEGDRP